ncbi:class I SAM-dependent DNA methyltransferase [Aeoliella sp.]|uniref:class I SAM-dependent DNA methyltransferase n=1 Tax=Aeoliella sp. TaxID=2795800 RepID=UPI003CCC2A90
MPATRHRIQFPPIGSHDLAQDEAYFYLVDGPDRKKRKLLLHDYDKIYNERGLYEQLFYDRLQCNSPAKVAGILHQTLEAVGQYVSELRVLDLGAGNGMMGEELKQHGVARLVGADIIPEARDACIRDRPELYDEYYVADFTDLSADTAEQIGEWNIDCLTSVAALGFGDIPPTAFMQGLRFVNEGGWVAFNIKETFLDASDNTGFSRFIRELIFSEYLDVFHLERYRHRLSMEGLPLFYYALVGRKNANIPDDFLQSRGIED